MPKKLILGCLAAVLAVFLVYTARLSRTADTGKQVETVAAKRTEPAAPASNPNAQCGQCHQEIYNEWLKDEHSKTWTKEVYYTFTENYTRLECLSCHAPKPMLETGLAKMPELRAENRASGIDCLTCHIKNGKTYGTLGSGAVCGGVCEPDLKTSQACFHCHSAHNLFKEYLASDYAKRGVSCQDCHMEQVTRPVAEGQAARKTRRHLFHGGGHDSGALKQALKLELAVKEKELVVTVTNVGAAHGVPGEISNRVVTLIVSIGTGPAGGAISDEVRAYREIFRAPPRLARDKIPSTQIMPGAPLVLRYPLPIEHGLVEASLSYKLEFSELGEGESMAQQALSF